MRIKKEMSVSVEVLSVAKTLLETRATELRGDLLEVFDALCKVTGKTETYYLKELQESIEFRIRILNPEVKRKVGRPRKEKVKTNGSK